MSIIVPSSPVAPLRPSSQRVSPHVSFRQHRVLALACAIAAAAVGTTISTAYAADALQMDAAARFGRVEHAPVRSLAEVDLGRALFWDTRLSLDGKTACASCHFAQDWGADRRRFSPDARGKPTSRHSPTIFNAMSQPMLRWLGDRKSGAEQAEGSMVGSMGFAKKTELVEVMRKHNYEPLFRAAYPKEAEPVSAAAYGKALEAYQATLTTPAAFDRYLAGDAKALTDKQKDGLRLFIGVGCAGCHSGPLLGGASLQRFGIVKEYWLATRSEKPDVGRYAMTKQEQDRYVFRVPMLRNVARTAPYFHDGSVATLDAAVRVMAEVQLGRTLSDSETGAIVEFLDALTGEVPTHFAPPARFPE
jgi:cytochrome c peroxidase